MTDVSRNESLTRIPEIEVVVRMRCEHGQIHPHAVTVFRADGWVNDEQRWCTAGNFHIFKEGDLSIFLRDVLAHGVPRVEKDLAEVKGPQLVTALMALVAR